MGKKAKVEEKPAGAAIFGRVKDNLKQGLVGLPNVGKSSIFNILTQQQVAAENFPFCTIDPSNARCAVPDDRYDHLCKIWEPSSKIPAFLWVTDIAGLVKGAAQGEGLGNAFLSHIQAVDGIYHVVRAFDADDVVHVENEVDPIRDMEIITSELCIKDLEYVEKQHEAALLQIRKDGEKTKMKGEKRVVFDAAFAKVKENLKNNIPIRTCVWSNQEIDCIRDFMDRLITTKAITYLVNLSKRDYCRQKNKWLPKIFKWIQEHGGGSIIPFSVEFEQEFFDLAEDPAAQEDFLKECAAKAEKEKVESAIPKIIKTGFRELNLAYFFTAGEQEVRAWPVYDGWLAPQAAGVIHTDFERGFIKAEVVGWEDYFSLQTTKGMDKVKSAGKYRQEGKTYRMQDGDIVHFMFNVTAAKKK